MLDTTTKRRIDTARDILVGKVPDPKSQVEQITIALIYKFMDDMDAESEELGGKRKFFTGSFARYGWAKLMRSGLGGHETLNLYAEGITKMPENPGIPPLFRDIFKNAYLPYRDPETLKSFLKIIDEFAYDHSERLGDAFEYLLSVLGSQGDAGQFRTPRHIIDFMVEVLAPQKADVILDPACGTAGFLISAYKHILKANTDAKGNSTLTPDDKGRLANPPFMSPKGGIKPHKRFSIQAKRSEVLFVDYMAEHLTPNGRAAIIVPEGIIFQSQTAYKDLRKLLVENSLVAVVSLPAGCFNPYSGVKTSILILDKSLAKAADTIAFFKVENDGYGLGAQRRVIDKNDLPQVKAELAEYLQALRSQQPITDIQPTCGLIVAKEKIATNGDYNLSGERYREGAGARISSYEFKKLGELCTIRTGKKDVNSGNENGKYPFFTCARQHTYSDEYSFDAEAILIAGNGDVGAVQYYSGRFEAYQRTYVLTDWVGIEGRFLYFLLSDRLKETVSKLKQGNTMPYIKLGMLTDFEIPLPPLEVQKEIVAEIEGYQKVINGARAVLDHYRPHIPIHPDWPMVAIENLVADGRHSMKAGPFGSALKKEFYVPSGYKIYGQEQVIRGNANFGDYYISEEKYRELESCKVKAGDVLISLVGTYGKTLIVPDDHEPGIINPRLLKLTLNPEKMIPTFFVAAFAQESVMSQVHGLSYGGTMDILSLKVLKNLCLPLPPLATQQAIVAEIEAEQALVAANRELIARFEKKIQATLARVWGEEISLGEAMEGMT